MGFFWIDGHLLCQDGNVYNVTESSTDNPLPIRRRTTFPFRVHMYKNVSMQELMTFSVQWSDSNNSFTDIPSTAITFNMLSPNEQKRDTIQRKSSEGWGNMLHSNMLTFTKLPAGLAVTTQLCQLSTSKCITVAYPDGIQRCNAHVRVGAYSLSRSYATFSFGGGTDGKDKKSTLPFGNVSISLAVDGTHKENLHVTIDPIGCNKINCSDLVLRVRNEYIFYRQGTVTIHAKEKMIHYQPTNLNATNISFTQPFISKNILPTSLILNSHPNDIFLSLSNGTIGISTIPTNNNIHKIQKIISTAKTNYKTNLLAKFDTPKLAEIGEAIEAAATWTAISTPAENGFSVLMPVSRAWSRVPPSANQFSYAIFDWDNLFASLLAASTGRKEVAYSNIIQSFKSKTAEGYLANCAGGGYKDQDRSEPPVGSKVLLSLYEKFQDKWIVELLFDDCLDW